MFVSFGNKLVALIAVVALLAVVVTGIIIYSSKKTSAPPAVVAMVEKEELPLTTSHKVIGASVEGRNIEAYSYGSGKRRVVFMGGIHGGYEWNSVFLAYTFIDYFETHPEFVPKDVTVYIVPSVNPDAVHKVTGKDGRFTLADVSKDKTVLESARFNANNVDINRNFDCNWKPKSAWRSKEVSAGTAPFSEPESKAVRDFILSIAPSAVVFWHSQASAVYASQCQKVILPETLTLMNLYAKAAGYSPVTTFDAYATTGAADDWLASIGIPAITVELETHETVEWEQNFTAVEKVLKSYSQ